MPNTMTRAAAESIAGTIGFPSKMPGTSYGLPAERCITGAKLATVPGSTCSNCYAFNGNYIYPSVQQAQAQRFASITDERWVAAIVKLITHIHATGRGRNGPIDSGWHRWHDSGDIQSEQHLANICAVARATPHIAHWLPTREHAIVARYVAVGNAIPDNLTIRMSATMIDGPATRAWPTTSSVHSVDAPKGAHGCPAPKQDGKCGPCRACWSHDVPHVSYHLHH